jgi:hypothetical protein
MARRSELERRLLLDEIVAAVSDIPAGLDTDEYDLLLTTAPDPPRPWVCAPFDRVDAAVRRSPAAAVALVEVLRATESSSVAVGLTIESMAYSMLQHAEVFRRWLAEGDAPADQTVETVDPVRLVRIEGELDIVLQRPHVHNALNAAMRDGLCEAFDLVAADPSIVDVHLRGDGPSFCSGGDLAEFGTATDAATAHLVRVARSVGRRVHEHAGRVTAHLHGSCIGAGIEISAFAGRVLASADTVIRLPELAMGLIPGAGGTVSLPRRIGRQRTAYLALTGEPIDAPTARGWGLVDEVL